MAWSPSIEIVTLEQAKEHLKLPLDITAEDDDLQIKLYIAHELVIDYLTQKLDDDVHDEWIETMETWTEATAPKRVIGAILYQFSELYRYRGDEPAVREVATLAPAMRLLLDRMRDPLVL
jgi:predicted DNA-binding protein (UPF0278 family)